MMGENSKSEIRNPKFELSVDSGIRVSDLGNRIFLIGHRCTGKTTVARLLAEKLGWDWLDADEVLETRFGTTIREIFASEGEAGFRDKEEKIFAELCQLPRHVIATGGGVILRENNRREMRSAGTVVWLTADAETIWKRLQADPSTAERRPSLLEGGFAEVEAVLKMREPVYRACADLAISTAGPTAEEVARRIAHEFSRGGVSKAQRDDNS